jgi:hypothetical protein
MENRKQESGPGFLMILCCVLLAYAASVATDCIGQSESPPGTSPAQLWMLKYSVEGGIAGYNEHLTLNQEGEVEVRSYQSQFRFTVPSKKLADIRQMVQQLDASAFKPVPPPPEMPDMIYSPFTITTGGHEYQIGPDGNGLRAVIESLLSEGLRRAEDQMFAKAGPFRLGRVWKVEEEVRDSQGMWHGELWMGTWTRINDSNVFGAVWRNNKSNQELRDTVVLDSAERGKIAMHRTSSNVKYDGWYSQERQDYFTGHVLPHND